MKREEARISQANQIMQGTEVPEAVGRLNCWRRGSVGRIR